uniref:Deacetylase sirtuin-type domain-containing protein n=1 Tax=Parascaris univalens TaxID=6257 RepID=A0A915CCB6_PARUN
ATVTPIIGTKRGEEIFLMALMDSHFRVPNLNRAAKDESSEMMWTLMKKKQICHCCAFSLEWIS